MAMKLDWPKEQSDGGAVGSRRRRVLVVVASVEAATWLSDALPLLAADHRIATFFTVAPVDGSRGTEEYLRARGFPTLSWRAAVGREFDLLLTHESGLAVSRNSFPDTVPVATVAGDLAYDRLLASIPGRAGYRRAFGLSPARKLVVVAWTETGESTVEDWFALLDKLVCALPPERYRVAAVVPAGLWGAHGGWQVRTWLADHLRAGLLLPQPEEDWRAALVAADLVVGDLGPATRYGAALGLPVMVASFAAGSPCDGVTGLLLRHAHRLRPDEPLLDQVVAARQGDRLWQDGIAARITAGAGFAGDTLRRTMYGLLGLTEPARPVPCAPVPAPRLVHDETAWLLRR